MKDKKNHQPPRATLPPDRYWNAVDQDAVSQDAVNNAFTDLLISVALEAGFMTGPRIDLGDPWRTLMLGLEVSVRPQKERVIEMIAEAFEPGDPALARRFAERMWEEFADRAQARGH
jgi:hypothetical protein